LRRPELEDDERLVLESQLIYDHACSSLSKLVLVEPGFSAP
jgi:hypothetical protein